MLLDQVEKLKVTDEEAQKYYNELRSLQYLSEGLSFLDHQVRMIEEETRRKLSGDEADSYYGFHPVLDGVPQPLVACFFHWYSVSVCNYVRLVGWLTKGQSPDEAKKYLESVIPEVCNWRNKVGAHFAQAYPKTTGRSDLKDNSATRAWSVIFPIMFQEGVFQTDPARLIHLLGEKKPAPPDIPDWRWRLLMFSGRKTVTSPENAKWSLTQVHGCLSSRYGFPKIEFPV